MILKSSAAGAKNLSTGNIERFTRIHGYTRHKACTNKHPLSLVEFMASSK
jgi:hypothetical protein